MINPYREPGKPYHEIEPDVVVRPVRCKCGHREEAHTWFGNDWWYCSALGLGTVESSKGKVSIEAVCRCRRLTR